MPDFVTVTALSVFGWIAVGRRDFIGVTVVVALAFALGVDHA